MKNSFVLYTDYRKHISLLNDTEKARLLDAIFAYADGEQVEVDGVVEMAFSFIKAQMDRDAAKWEEERQARSDAGKKGMANRWRNKKAITNDNTVITNDNKDNTVIARYNKDNKAYQDITNVTVTVTDNVNDTVTDNVTVKSKGKTQAFCPPSLDEVKDYCWERKNKVDAQAFIDFYTSKGWMIGKTKMKDWKAAVRTWERRDSEKVLPIRDNKREVDDFFRRELGV